MGALGYLGVLVSVLGFGSNFVPLKKLKIGDGIFFQFCMCTAIFMTSIPVLIIQGFPKIHGLALFGGFLWCSGNMLCPIVIRLIGMGLGLLVWGSVGMIMGWASGTYGLFGLKKQEINDPTLNLIGVVVAMVGLLVFLQVRTNGGDNNNKTPNDDGSKPLLRGDDVERKMMENIVSELDGEGGHEKDFLDKLDDGTKRVVGLLLAMCAGIFFGTSFDPSQWVIDNDFDGNDDSLNYVFPHYCGILLTSWFYTMCYLIYTQYQLKKTPYVAAEIILPATLSGILWGIAEIAWFFANGQLGFSVTFPIISCGPGFVGSLWGIFLFKEITEKRDFLVLLLAVVITVPALIMVAMSH
jgi:hypothetical protein